ncbi:MAG: hypothetical protein HYU62_00260 [Caulobacterales bacterium]|nr:hypothetical protein [Caulobacterales bacterium]
MAVRLGDRHDEIGGSRVFVGPEDALMRAVLTLIAGDWNAQARFPAENDDFTMTLRMFVPHDGVVRTSHLEYPCELIWSEVDQHSQPIETRSLGVAPSVLQLAEAAHAFGQTYYADRTPSAALMALGAALSAVRLAPPAF